jgi:hypothetical protein
MCVARIRAVLLGGTSPMGNKSLERSISFTWRRRLLCGRLRDV